MEKMWSPLPSSDGMAVVMFERVGMSLAGSLSDISIMI